MKITAPCWIMGMGVFRVWVRDERVRLLGTCLLA